MFQQNTAGKETASLQK